MHLQPAPSTSYLNGINFLFSVASFQPQNVVSFDTFEDDEAAVNVKGVIQPALVRPWFSQNFLFGDNLKYELIFGKRTHLKCC